MTTLPARFWAKVEKTDTCWLWKGRVMWKGYGMFRFENRPDQRVHRLAYAEVVGPIPAEMTIDHLCRNRVCVNPDHLEVVTREENTRRARALVTHCKRGHELPPRTPHATQRVCLICVRALRASRKARSTTT